MDALLLVAVRADSVERVVYLGLQFLEFFEFSVEFIDESFR